MHEIVTLQFGTAANYLGTHFWNTQESYFTYGGEESLVDHDVLFRPGIAPDGSDTFTPRALIYDLKESFGNLRQINALYEAQEQGDAGLWRGNTIIQRANPIPQNSFQQALDSGLEPPPLSAETVRYWSDYNRVFYHPRSLVQIGAQTLGSSLNPFEKYETGEELFDDLDKEHDLLDRDLRRFLEECDQLQALQIVTSVGDAWGGFASKFVERLRDEFEKGGIWVWGIEDGTQQTREKQIVQTVNTAQSIYSLATQASAYVPLNTLPTKLPLYLNPNLASPWKSSALLATAVESMTLPSRLRERTTFDAFESILSNDGKRKIEKFNISVQDPEEVALQTSARQSDTRVNGYSNGYHTDDEEPPPDDLDLDVSESRPLPSNTTRRRRRRIFSRVDLFRGPWPVTPTAELTPFDRFGSRTVVQSYRTSLLFPLLSSFPPLFTFATTEGKLAVRATLSTETGIADRVRELAQFVGRAVGVEEREALRNGLLEVSEEYVEGWESESEDEDD